MTLTLLGIAVILFVLSKLIEWLAPDDRTRRRPQPSPLVHEVRSPGGVELLRDDPGPRRLPESLAFDLDHLAQRRAA
jgi:hypothetical protein